MRIILIFKAFLKSEEIPEKNDEPVKIIVGKSFQNEVINNNKDVLVEFYAPWYRKLLKI